MKMNVSRWEKNLWTGGGAVYRFFASPLGSIYSLAANTRAALFQKGILKSYRPRCVVVSVGNLTPGGSGKTPLVLALGKTFSGKGLKTVTLTRGYRGSGKDRAAVVAPDADPSVVGDEPAMMARIMPSVPIIRAAQRARGAKTAEEIYNPDIILLDDGFGHLALARDFDIVVVDALRGFGNCKTIPAGPLREPISQLKRADCVIVTYSNIVETGRKDELKKVIGKYAPESTVLEAAFRVEGIIRNAGEPPEPLDLIVGRKVVAFSGIGNPSAFRRTIENLNIEVAAFLSFPDHHYYMDSDINDITRALTGANSSCALTTEKDLARLGKRKFPAELFALRIAVEVERFGWLTDRILGKS